MILVGFDIVLFLTVRAVFVHKLQSLCIHLNGLYEIKLGEPRDQNRESADTANPHTQRYGMCMRSMDHVLKERDICAEL